MPRPVPDLPQFLTGRWELRRRITDPAGRLLGTFTGHGCFTAAEAGWLDYRERGALRLGEHEGPASRHLRYELTGPGQARVHFGYGGFFHDLDLRPGRCGAEHPCRADRYRGEFEVVDADRWWQRWTVTGPAKDHVLTTWLHRCPHDES
ncbi:DUF6314 family protein [Saccharopolyspora cebuensis]|uniref:DUF6314 family protein n=1 Tax=Saccharopolyspora cebuensis TaxID=418759 RepID=A0ABV4CD44_9PSEU